MRALLRLVLVAIFVVGAVGFPLAEVLAEASLGQPVELDGALGESERAPLLPPFDHGMAGDSELQVANVAHLPGLPAPERAPRAGRATSLRMPPAQAPPRR